MISFKPALYIDPFSTRYFLPEQKKIVIGVNNYSNSDPFNIDTFGVSGSITLSKKNNAQSSSLLCGS